MELLIPDGEGSISAIEILGFVNIDHMAKVGAC